MKLLHDTWLLFARGILTTIRNPVWAIIGLFQPLCYLLLFAPLLQAVSGVPGFPPGGALTVFTPGVLVMMAIFSTAFNGFGLLMEVQSGLIERLRITPVSRWALLLGRILRDVLLLLIQSLVLVLVAWFMGARMNPLGLALTFGLLVLIGLCLSSCSYALALALKDANALSSFLNTLSLPIVLLSGITLPLTLAPPVLRAIANFDPFAYEVSAARLLFNGNIANAAVLQGFVIMVVLTLLALLWGVRSFQRTTA
ncbi:MAG: ABC transporter permease [Ktedonobacteraceae bacterium]|nr:ABC transporter permease [Chloroflexota bacterium]